jgi:hypothetical protein
MLILCFLPLSCYQTLPKKIDSHYNVGPPRKSALVNIS